jgi:ribonuclease VapC
MVIDTSAVMAILFDEADAPFFEEAIEADPVRLMSAGTLVEAAIVVEARLGPAGGRELDLLLHAAAVDIVPVDREQAELGRQAWRRFGKGNHRAALNYGDCFAYALAKRSGEPLLAKGDDFPRTDVTLALRAPASSEIHEPAAPYGD